jgi:hypothetical protein
MLPVNVKIVEIRKLDNKFMKVYAIVTILKQDGTTKVAKIDKKYEIFKDEQSILTDLENYVKDEFSSLFAIEEKERRLMNKEINFEI